MDMRQPDDPRFTRVILRRELLAEGWNDRAIAAQLAAGVWVRARHGAYVERTAWQALDTAGRHEVTARAVLKQAKTPMALSHVSGVALYDGPVWGLDLASVHGTRLDGKTGRAEAGVIQHVGAIRDGDLTTRHGIEVMSPTRIVLETSTVASNEAALVVANDFLHRKLTSPEKLRERYNDGIVRWPRTLGTDLVIRLADPRIESVLETRFSYLCFRHHLPAPEPQYEVRDPETGELVARLDFAWPELGRYVECNGKHKYDELLTPGQRAADVVFKQERRAERVHAITKMVGMHIGWADVQSPLATAANVRAFLAAGRPATG